VQERNNKHTSRRPLSRIRQGYKRQPASFSRDLVAGMTRWTDRRGIALAIVSATGAEKIAGLIRSVPRVWPWPIPAPATKVEQIQQIEGKPYGQRTTMAERVGHSPPHPENP